jgi:O-antigen/teichoic acid export membrane protein
MCCASLALAVFSPEIVQLMADKKFFESHPAMPIVVGGYVCWAVYQVASTGLYVRQKTGAISILVGAAAVLNLTLNQLLVPSMGYMGAAWATLATFGVLAVATWVVAERAMHVGYEIFRVLLPVVLAVALYAVSLRIPGGGIALRSALVLVLPIFLWTCGYLRAQEKAELVSVVRSLAGPFRRR